MCESLLLVNHISLFHNYILLYRDSERKSKGKLPSIV